MNNEQLDELRSWIVDCGQEENFLRQLNDQKHRPFFEEWLGLVDDEEED
jgi:hypothetical protein